MKKVLAVLGLSCMGCGSLSVDVAILDPEVLERAQQVAAEWKAEALLREELFTVTSLSRSDVESRVDDIANEHFQYYTAVGELARAEGANAYADQLQEDFNAEISPDYEDAKVRLLVLWESISSLAASRTSATSIQRGEINEDLVVSLHRWQRVLENLQAVAARDSAELADSFFQNIQASPDGQAVQDVEAAKDFLRKRRSSTLSRMSVKITRLSTTTLDADPLAAAVAGAPESAWNNRFHKVWGRALLGNFNMAIKMEKGPSENTFPEFTLKGLTFDPSDVVRMASRVASQGLALAARLAGVSLTNVSGESTQPAGAAIAGVSSPLAAKQAEVSTSELATRTHDRALQSLAVAVLQSWDDLVNTDPKKRKAALAALRSSYDAIKQNLQMSSASTSPQEPEEAEEEETEEEGAGEGEEENEEDETGGSPP